MVFSIVITGLWIVTCVAGQILYPDSYSPAIPWSGGLSPYTPIVPSPVPFESKTQYHYQDGFGFGKYGYSEPTSTHHASHDAAGNKAGEFSYVRADGTVHKTRYVADSLGYRPISNDLPVGPIESPAIHSLKKRSVYPYAAEPTVSQSGYLTDTPEVAAAKASHFQEHAKRGNYHMVAALTPSPAPYSTWSAPAFQQQQPVANPVSVVPSTYSSWSTAVGKQPAGVTPYSFNVAPYASWSTQVGGWPSNTYSSPQAGYPVVTSDGYLKDTPEVAQAKAAHFAAKAKIVVYPSYETKTQPDAYNYYPAPAASVPVNYGGVNQFVASARSGFAPITPEGQVTDTPEVNAAKISHFADYAAALARTGGGGGGVDSSYVTPQPQQYSFPTTYSHASGVPAETPEVAQARAAHFSEYARVANRLKRSISYGNYPASTQPLTPPPVVRLSPFDIRVRTKG